jgi:heptosyltransferase-2
MPGAEYGPAKQWPPAHYAELARLLAAKGFQVWVLGSKKDSEAARPIAAADPGVRDFTGRTELGEAVELLALARAAVTNDSGLMHVAAALDVPLVAIFGSSSPEHTPPLALRVAIESLRLECSPCFERHCPFGHTRCLTDIAPTKVLAALEPFIGEEN